MKWMKSKKPRSHCTLAHWPSIASTAALAVALLTGCSNTPPTPEWKQQAHAALTTAERAFMDGQSRIFTHEAQKARREIAATANPALLANLELRYCALQVASLNWEPCTAYLPLHAAADESARAYHGYLYTQVDATRIHLLPAPQQGVARATSVQQAAAHIQRIEDPLSRLLATAVALRRTGQADPGLLQLGVDTASERGWRRPLLAWLKLLNQYAQSQQDHALLAQTQLRIELLEGNGQLQPGPQAPVILNGNNGNGNDRDTTADAAPNPASNLPVRQQ